MHQRLLRLRRNAVKSAARVPRSRADPIEMIVGVSLAAMGGTPRRESAPTATEATPTTTTGAVDPGPRCPRQSSWNELDDPALRPDALTIRAVLDRLAERREVFRAVLASDQTPRCSPRGQPPAPTVPKRGRPSPDSPGQLGGECSGYDDVARVVTRHGVVPRSASEQGRGDSCNCGRGPIREGR